MRDYKIRDSNLELLRLVCMFFIVIHHCIINGLKISGYHLYEENTTYCGVIINAFVCIAVDCFVLISGYYGIKAKWKGFFSLYFTCAFYGVMLFLFSHIYTHISLKELLFSFMPFSHSQGLWFIPCYIFLFLLSPILNKIVGILDKKEYISLLLIFSILTFYFGYLWKCDINPSGYTIMNFIYLYFIGQYIARYYNSKSTPLNKTLIYLGIYLFCSLFIGMIAVVILHLGIAKTWILTLCFGYNSPFVILSAIAFFLFFRSLHIKNISINWFASSALAIYLLTENINIRDYLFSYAYNLDRQINNGWVSSILFLFLIVCVMIICILIDKIRIFITNPIEKAVNKIDWQGYSNKLVNKLTKFL